MSSLSFPAGEGRPSDDLTLGLLDLWPDLAALLTDEEQEAARRVRLPTQRLAKGPLDIDERLGTLGAFGAVLIDGMVLEQVRVTEQLGLRLLGPGDVLSVSFRSRCELISCDDCRVVAPTVVAVLGRELLVAAHHWPGLLRALQVSAAAQQDRLMAQLVICQLPRVDQRLLALMWLLAETWGRVTPNGVTLPLSLTHDVLGGLIGARRSTVTLALGELAERGALIRQDAGWLLIERPATSAGDVPELEDPRLLVGMSPWRSRESTIPGGSSERNHADLLDTVMRLREQHLATRTKVRSQLERLKRLRQQQSQLGRRARAGLTRRSAPSSGSRR